MLYQTPNEAPKFWFSRLLVRIKKGLRVCTHWASWHRWLTLGIVAVLLVGSGFIVYQANRTNPMKASNNPVVAQYQKQLPSLKQATEQKPNDELSRKNYAVALYVTGDLSAAKAQYEKAVDLNSKDAVAWNNLGNTDRDLGKADEAVTAYQQSLKADPKAINTYVNLANLQLYTLNKPNDAIATYHQALAQLPDNAQLALLLALAYEQAGDKTTAKQTLQTLLAKNPNNEAAKANLTRINQ